ncbi:MAG: hypothetical protein OXI24_12160 [Candidatus Poribacteria bacterium]|nr:hypothetical protein [Candidatus Poribacteria bacterium]
MISIIYIFTDYDYAGETIVKQITDGLKRFSDKDITVASAMLTATQVKQWNLPTRQPKANDVKHGYDVCCELDAVNPAKMREHLRHLITQHIQEESLRQIRTIESQERKTILETFSYLT